MNAVIGYNSSVGHTRRLAEAIAAELGRRGIEASIMPVQRVTAADIDRADVLFFGTWAHGLFVVRVHPAGMEYWLRDLPDLRGKPTAAFATFLFRPAGLIGQLTAGLESRSARVVTARAFRRDRYGDVGAFVDAALAGVAPVKG